VATFTKISPTPDQTDVVRTAVVSFTILDGAEGTKIDTLAVTLDGYQAISAGAFVGGYNGKIFSTAGKYVVGIYPKAPEFFRNAAKINVHFEVRDNSDSLVTYDYSFYTTGYIEPTTPESPTSTSFRACLEVNKPFFPPTDLGLVAVLDSGVGTEVELQWKSAAPNNEDNVIFYNVYYSTKRIEVFDGYPDFLVSDISATIGGLPPGDAHYFAVRVAEFDPLAFTISGLMQAGPDMYFYPTSIIDGYIDAYATIIPGNTDGFPNFGIINIDTELIRYSTVQSSGFVVATNGRGFAETLAEAHQVGTEIKLYSGKEDGNTIIVRATPTFQKPNYALTWVRSDGYGADGYRDGYDGYDGYYNNGPGANNRFDGYDGYYLYHQQPFDTITTDGTNNDASGTFARFDYCGTWRTMSPQSIMQGQCRQTYFGGAQVRIDDDGYRHLVKVTDVRTHMLQREELLLESTGEPFVLLRRMWTGSHCMCFMNRREHPDARCQICFGTGFVQGYIQFFNPRRPDKRILVRIDPAADDLNIVDRGGLEPVYEPSAWTLPFPAIKDRDILVRFNPNNTEEFRYEILDVTRVRAMFTQTGAQKFRIKRMPKTDIAYQFPIVRDTRPIPGALVTSIGSGPGLNPHTHQLVINAGTDLSNLRVATLMTENHNHIVINGVVQSVLGHTHTL
jgi:hypothetical protein